MSYDNTHRSVLVNKLISLTYLKEIIEGGFLSDEMDGDVLKIETPTIVRRLKLVKHEPDRI